MRSSESHPWIWFVPENSRVLIVGTFPPTKRNWSYDFFYPNKRNLFWPMMAAVAGRELKYFSGAEAVEERKDILRILHTGVTDMGLEIFRNLENSSDENLEVAAFVEILDILADNPAIKKIIFTSSSGRSSAAGWFLQYLRSKGIIHKFPRGERPLRSELRIGERIVELVILYSPSPRAANRISFEKLVALYQHEIET